MIGLSHEFRARLAELPVPEQKRRIRAAWQHTDVRRRHRFLILGAFCAWMVLLVLRAAEVIPLHPASGYVTAGFVLIVLYVAQWDAARCLRGSLVRDRPEICAGCGYLIRRATRCPECGTERDP